MSIDLYGSKTGNSLRTAVALEEAGLSYTPRRLDLNAGAQRSPEHLARNPRGKIPVLVVSGEGGEFVLTQSNAIQLWADAKAPGALLPREGCVRAVAIERWLHVVTDVIMPNSAFFRLRRAGLAAEAGAHLEGEATRGIAELQRMLTDTPFLAGDAVTLADLAAYTIAAHYEAALDWPRLPRLRRWFETIGARPGVRRGMAAFD